MKNRLSISAILLTVVLLGCAVLILNPKVKAAEESKITRSLEPSNSLARLRT